MVELCRRPEVHQGLLELVVTLRSLFGLPVQSRKDLLVAAPLK